MKRNQDLALNLLVLIETHADPLGLGLAVLQHEYAAMHGTWSNDVVHHLDLLIDGGFILKRVANDVFPGSVQLTWSGHDLIASLRKELNR